jgi:hypothetical protein
VCSSDLKDLFFDGVQYFKDLDTTVELDISCPYGQVGDILWVRETWNWAWIKIEDSNIRPEKNNKYYFYKADQSEHLAYRMSWKPSLHMPKEAARIFLKITEIQVERLYEISENDAVREGIKSQSIKRLVPPTTTYYNYIEETYQYLMPSQSFFSLWASINGSESLELNPWVWVITFELIDKPENFI